MRGSVTKSAEFEGFVDFSSQKKKGISPVYSARRAFRPASLYEQIKIIIVIILIIIQKVSRGGFGSRVASWACQLVTRFIQSVSVTSPF